MKNINTKLFRLKSRFFLFTIIMIGLSFQISAQEICNNGIDDDGDNLVDCADPDCSGEANCSDTFTCSSDLYQVTSGVLKVLDPATGTYTTIGDAGQQYNGTGYNVQDGYIYGILSGNPDLVRLNNQGQFTVVGSISNFTGLTYSGDFDLDGNWLSFKKSGSTWEMGSLDVDAFPLTMNSYSVTDLSTTVASSSCADISYNAVTGKYYGCSSGRIIEFDPVNKTVRGLADYSSSAEGGSYGAAWSDIDGNTYFFNNNTGNIYRAQFDQNGEVSNFNFIAVSEPNGSNDGMSCPLSSPPSFPEFCGNGIDDDNDGLVDCDDPDCTNALYCCDDTVSGDCDGDGVDNLVDCAPKDDTIAYQQGGSCTTSNGDPGTADANCLCIADSGATSGGTGGGLESNRRLSDKIAKFKYQQTINPSEELKAKEKGAIPFKKPESFNKNNEIDINDLIPTDIWGAYIADSSPEHLIDITNATEIVGADYYLNDNRNAVVLILKSEDGVYEHSKYICDRLDGASLLDVYKTSFNFGELITYEIETPQGLTEYAISFSGYIENDEFIMHNHWSLDDYPAQATYYNFQIWAASIEQTQSLIYYITNKLEEYVPIGELTTSNHPYTFVKNGFYKNGKVHLNVVNRDGETTLSFNGNYRSTESAGEAIYQEEIDLNGNYEEEEVLLNTGYIYDMGLSVTLIDGLSDELFIADGSWGADTENENSIVESFEVIPHNETYDPSVLMIERGFNLEASVFDFQNIYRSITPKWYSVDLSTYSNLEFKATGTGTMRITLVNPFETDWNKQIHTTISLNEQEQTYLIPVNTLDNFENAEDLSNINAVVISLIGDNENWNDLDLSFSGLELNNDEIFTSTAQLSTGESFQIYPNPASDYIIINSESLDSQSLSITVIDCYGREIGRINTNSLSNEQKIDLSNYHSGLYFINLYKSDKLVSSEKLYINH